MRHNGLLLFLMAFLLCLTGCKNIKDIEVTSVKLESVSLNGFKSLDLHLSAQVSNPARQVKLSEIEGSIVHSGKIIGELAMDPFTLTARSTDRYNLKANVGLAQGAGLKDLMLLAEPSGLNECTVNVSAKATYGKGVPVPVKMKDIPLKELLNSIGNEKN